MTNKRRLSWKPRVPKIFFALKTSIKEGYSAMDLKADLMSGLIVGLVAIPLGMALAIASGVPPQYGLYTVIIGGGLVALLGGSKFQVTGPTAAFVVILVPIVHKFGFAGLLTAGFMAGLMLVALGVLRIGGFIRYIPKSIILGFTAGIAVVIATIQIKDFFGLRLEHMPETYILKLKVLFDARGTVNMTEFVTAAATLALIVMIPKFTRKIPAPLLAVSLVTLATTLLKWLMPEFEIATIGNHFVTQAPDGVTIHGIPPGLPEFSLPWLNHANLGGTPQVGVLDFMALLPSALAIALLGAIESLLSAVIADGMTDTKHDPNAELTALGLGNIICSCFGGIAATGAIARTATNIRFGARSPLSAVVHAIFVLSVVAFFASMVSFVPMAALASLLLFVSYTMSDIGHVIRFVRKESRAEVFVLLACFFLTVLFDMVIGVSIGMFLYLGIKWFQPKKPTSSHPHAHQGHGGPGAHGGGDSGSDGDGGSGGDGGEGGDDGGGGREKPHEPPAARPSLPPAA